MYGDHSPEPRLTDRVLVVEEGDCDAEEIMDAARDEGAVSEDRDGDEIFWIVFANEPNRVWDFTERSLRSSKFMLKTGAAIE